MMIAPNSRARKGGELWCNLGMVQPSQQHVAPCIKYIGGLGREV